MTHISTVVEVEERHGAKGRVWWRVKTADGKGYSTRNMIAAALCDRARAMGTAVEINSSSGWYYRTIDNVRLV